MKEHGIDTSSVGRGTSPRTRGRILAAAAELLARDTGASLAQIGAAAGVGRTTVHRYFPTREGLIEVLAVESMRAVRDALIECRLDDGSVPEVLGRIADAVLPLAAELRYLDTAQGVWELPELRRVWDAIVGDLDRLVERGQRDRDLRADVPAALVVNAFVGALWGVDEGIREGRIAPAGASRRLVALLLDGITTQRGA
jgi:AcrR family transcriptional regulator